jgi:hypothetical protein
MPKKAAIKPKPTPPPTKEIVPEDITPPKAPYKKRNQKSRKNKFIDEKDKNINKILDNT